MFRAEGTFLKKCKYCAEEVQDEAKFCKHCGKRLATSTLVKGALWTFGVFIALVITLAIIGTLVGPQELPSVTASGRLEPGERGKITETTYAARDKNSWEELRKFVIAKDITGVQGLWYVDRVIQLKEGTEVLVIESQDEVYRVRVLSLGDYYGREGLVYKNQVARVSPDEKPAGALGRARMGTRPAVRTRTASKSVWMPPVALRR